MCPRQQQSHRLFDRWRAHLFPIIKQVVLIPLILPFHERVNIKVRWILHFLQLFFDHLLFHFNNTLLLLLERLYLHQSTVDYLIIIFSVDWRDKFLISADIWGPINGWITFCHCHVICFFRYGCMWIILNKMPFGLIHRNSNRSYVLRAPKLDSLLICYFQLNISLIWQS